MEDMERNDGFTCSTIFPINVHANFISWNCMGRYNIVAGLLRPSTGATVHWDYRPLGLPSTGATILDHYMVTNTNFTFQVIAPVDFAYLFNH